MWQVDHLELWWSCFVPNHFCLFLDYVCKSLHSWRREEGGCLLGLCAFNGELTSLLFLFLVRHGRSKCFGFNWFKWLWWWEIGIAATIRSGMLHKARHFLVFGELNILVSFVLFLGGCLDFRCTYENNACGVCFGLQVFARLEI
jgi:hypothetical protein